VKRVNADRQYRRLRRSFKRDLPQDALRSYRVDPEHASNNGVRRFGIAV
jgi:hypothetical protein